MGFVDSDDYVTKDMFEKMYNEAKKLELDIVSCGYKKVSDDGKLLSANPFPLQSNKVLIIIK